MLRKNREEGRSRRFRKEIAIRGSLYMEVPLQEPLNEKILLFRSSNWSSQCLELSFCLRNKDYTMIACILCEIVFSPRKKKFWVVFLCSIISFCIQKEWGSLWFSLSSFLKLYCPSLSSSPPSQFCPTVQPRPLQTALPALVSVGWNHRCVTMQGITSLVR